MMRLGLAGALLGVALLGAIEVARPVAGIGAALAQPVPSSARPGQRSCSEAKRLRSLHSREPTRITFVNRSGLYRALLWVDFQGKLKDYGGLNPGERKSFDTFRTHPWMSATGPGDCIRIYLPSAEPGTVILR